MGSSTRRDQANPSSPHRRGSLAAFCQVASNRSASHAFTGTAFLGITALLALAGCANPQLKAFERTLAADPSATAALRTWCMTRQLSTPPAIRATPVKDGAQAPPAEATALLGKVETGYRHVRLSCGDRVLSEAHNWYVPARLSPEMNAMLAKTDAPFGQVAAPLGFRRERLGSKRGAMPGCPPATILSHRALLRLRDGHPLAYVLECYTLENLASQGS